MVSGKSEMIQKAQIPMDAQKDSALRRAGTAACPSSLHQGLLCLGPSLMEHGSHWRLRPCGACRRELFCQACGGGWGCPIRSLASPLVAHHRAATNLLWIKVTVPQLH